MNEQTVPNYEYHQKPNNNGFKIVIALLSFIIILLVILIFTRKEKDYNSNYQNYDSLSFPNNDGDSDVGNNLDEQESEESNLGPQNEDEDISFSDYSATGSSNFTHATNFQGQNASLLETKAEAYGVDVFAGNPLFANYYTFFTVGCGTGCGTYYMIDLRNGVSYNINLDASTQMFYQPDSLLFISAEQYSSYIYGPQKPAKFKNKDAILKFELWNENSKTFSTLATHYCYADTSDSGEGLEKFYDCTL